MRSTVLAMAVLATACGTTSGGDDTGGGGDDDGGGGGSACDPSKERCDGCMTADRDGDGWADEIEVATQTSTTDANETPVSGGDIVFVVPYQANPSPPSHDLETTAKLNRADLAILLDTTGSMVGTTSRIQGQLAEIVSLLAGEVDDLAFGAAGYGDFPVYDGANSQYDVPFYLTHRVMTARTTAGLASITAAFTYKNIIVDGLGGWFAVMRGGDEPEQHWEALRQAATGMGITYPGAFSGTQSVPPFGNTSALPHTIPPGEEVGTIGGFGFRKDSLPIILQITDTNAQAGGLTTTTPVSATRPVALAALEAIHARVVGIMAWITVGHDDLTAMTIDTGGQVPPAAWGVAPARPANCPVGKCCTVAEDEVMRPQPDPINGLCPLVFQADRYTQNLSKMVAQAVIGIARGAKFQISAELRDDPSDDVDVTELVESVDAIADGACAGASVSGSSFTAVAGGQTVCFRITPRVNATVPAGPQARRYRGVVQLLGDGVGSFSSREVWFVVPTAACTPPIFL